MPRTQHGIDAAERLQERLDRIDAGDEEAGDEDAAGLRNLGEAVIAHAKAGRAVDDAVDAAVTQVIPGVRSR